MDKKEVCAAFKKYVYERWANESSPYAAAAKEYNVSANYICMVCNCNNDNVPAGKMLDDMGVKRVVSYEKKGRKCTNF